MTVTTENRLKPNHPVHRLVLETIHQGTGKKVYWSTGESTQAGKGMRQDFIVSMTLDAGPYRLGQITGIAGDDISLVGHSNAQSGLGFQVPNAGVTYLGHLSLVFRERKEGEPRAGPMLPLVDQLTTGLYESTMEVSVTDGEARDLDAIRKTYPFLQDLHIGKSLLSKMPAVK